ncbi:MAG: glycosyltransferase [Acidobacteriota bacterium]|nr:glycosyltransferase [Blastocatellia bacterium]MDW8238444.1 glycosyltransferase [Acidobacteriota bacterium]
MKVLYLVDVQGQLGDAIRVSKMYKALKRAGADVTVVNFKETHQPRWRLFTQPWVLARSCVHAVMNWQLSKLAMQAKLYALVAEKKIRAVKPDLLWCETELVGGVMAPLAQRHAIPLVTDIHGLTTAEYAENPFQKIVPAHLDYFRAIEQQTVAGSQVLITVSKPMSDYFVNQHGVNGERLVCIPNGSDPSPVQARFREPLKVIYGGALVFWEHVDAFLDTSKRATRHEFYLAGSGYLKDHLINRIETEQIRMIYLGSVPRNNIMNVFARMQVGMAPSTDGLTRRVACPIKVFDYLACGLPVITPQYGEWADVVKQHRCGIVTERSDGEQFHQALEQLTDRPLWEEMSANGVHLIKTAWNWDRLTEPVAMILKRFGALRVARGAGS